METGPFGDIFPTEKGDIPLLCHIMNLPEGKSFFPGYPAAPPHDPSIQEAEGLNSWTMLATPEKYSAHTKSCLYIQCKGCIGSTNGGVSSLKGEDCLLHEKVGN